MEQQSLYTKAKNNTVVTIICSGCGTTAGQSQMGDVMPKFIPHDWCAVWARRNGKGLALWCAQCQHEGRHERNQQTERA